MKYIFLINKFTVLKKEEQLIKKIKKVCEKLKINYVIEVNGENYTTEDILEKYKDTKNVIIAVGGDGIINRVLNKIINTKNILGFIPYGTGNDLYKSALKDLDELTKCDIVKINDKYFINVACFGIDADVANNKEVSKNKYIPKKQKYLISLLKTFFKYENRLFKLTINNEVIEDYFATIVVCNAKYYGNGFMIGPKSSITDGLFEIYYVRNISKLETLKLILKMKNGHHENSKNINKVSTNKILIESNDKIKCNIDGEILEDKRFEIELIKNGITLYFNKKLIKEILK